MKKSLLIAAAVALLSTGASQAATLDFAAAANGNEQGFADGTIVTLSGVDVELTSSHFAYFDSGGDAGLGVCQGLIGFGTGPNGTENRCNQASDDNVTSGESVTLGFDTAFDVSGFLFRNANHGVIGASSMHTLLFGTNGGLLSQITFGDLMASTFSGVSSMTFAFDNHGPNAKQFYLSSVAAVPAVPLPAGMVLLLTGLGGMGFAARRRKSS